jgi:hypothetical protein
MGFSNEYNNGTSWIIDYFRVPKLYLLNGM